MVMLKMLLKLLSKQDYESVIKNNLNNSFLKVILNLISLLTSEHVWWHKLRRHVGMVQVMSTFSKDTIAFLEQPLFLSSLS